MPETFADVVTRVEAFQFDPEPRALTFPQRLARENRWSLEFAARVIREYRRFCVLAVCSGHPVTPSEQVDQAWHLHLTYSRSYWNRFCPEVLRMELHHEPTAGGAAEGRKFQDWYARTLERYERFFGERPPADIWPSPQQRFANAGDWCWVNRGRVWIIPRPTRALWSIDFVSIFILVFSGGLGLSSDRNLNVWVLLIPIVSVGLFGIWLTDFLMRLTGLKLTPRPELISADSIPERSSEDTIADLLARTNSRLEYFAVLMNETNHLAALSFVRQLQEGRIEAVADPEDASLLSLVAVPGRAPQGPSLDAEVYGSIRSGKTSAEWRMMFARHRAAVEAEMIQRGLVRVGPFPIIVSVACCCVAIFLIAIVMPPNLLIKLKFLAPWLILGFWALVYTWVRNQFRLSPAGRKLFGAGGSRIDLLLRNEQDNVLAAVARNGFSALDQRTSFSGFQWACLREQQLVRGSPPEDNGGSSGCGGCGVCGGCGGCGG